MPPWKFILIYGLTFGIMAAVFSAALDVLTGGYTVSQVVRKRIWINLAMAPIAGVFFGYILRWFITRQYAKLKAKEFEP